MNTIDSYNLKLETLKAIEDLKEPNIPMSAVVHESEGLKVQSGLDREVLLAVGLDPGVVDDLPVRIEVMKHAEGKWHTMRFKRSEQAAEWAEKAKVAQELRKKLLHDLSFAFRDDEELMKGIKDVSKSTRKAEMIADLKLLVSKGNDYPELLAAINFDTTLLEQATAMSAEVYAALYLSKIVKETKIIRDQAFTHLDEAVETIRDYGQYVFWEDEEKVNKYRSEYSREYNKNRTADEQEGELFPVEGPEVAAIESKAENIVAIE
ncbi:MAG: hypothetical protein GY765_38250 [bacterium]|nr:hypothetical protein [bacterium]